MLIKYQILEDNRLFIQKFIGQFDISEYMKYMQFINPVIAKHQIETVLIDFREMFFGENPHAMPPDLDEQVTRMIEIRKKANSEQPNHQNVSIIFWVDKPVTTVIADLFTRNFPNQHYHFCTTPENIQKIIRTLSVNELNMVCATLRNTYNSM